MTYKEFLEAHRMNPEEVSLKTEAPPSVIDDIEIPSFINDVSRMSSMNLL